MSGHGDRGYKLYQTAAQIVYITDKSRISPINSEFVRGRKVDADMRFFIRKNCPVNPQNKSENSMKKNPINLVMTCTAAALLMFTACKKTAQEPTPSENVEHSDDQMQFTAEMDAVTDEANDLIRESASFNFRNTSNG